MFSVVNNIFFAIYQYLLKYAHSEFLMVVYIQLYNHYTHGKLKCLSSCIRKKISQFHILTENILHSIDHLSKSALSFFYEQF